MFKGKDGSVFYDIGAKIGTTNASLHIGLSQKKIDEDMHPLLKAIVFLGMSTILIGSIFSLFFVQWTTEEVNRLTEELRKSEVKYRSLFEDAPAFIYVLDKKGNFIDINSRALRRLGYKREELIGKPLPKIFTPASIKIFEKKFPVLLSQGYAQAEVDLVTKNGEIISVDCCASVIWNKNGKIEHIVDVERDITEQKRVEKILKENEVKYRALFDASIDAIFLETLDGKILDCNHTACKIFGYTKEELINLTVADLVPEEVAKNLPEISTKLSSVGNIFVESLGKRKDGSIFPSEISARVLEMDNKKLVVVYLRDITEQRELQERLRQTQKMEAIGTLAGGIAHDFNNLLTVIEGHAEIALMKAKDMPFLRKDIEAIMEAGERAASLVNQLLAFSRKQPCTPKIVDVNKVIADFEKILRRLISEDIKMEIILAKELPSIKVLRLIQAKLNRS